MKILDEIRAQSKKHFPDRLAAAKSEGKKIIGYFCSYMPEEIIHASGMIPYRMRAVGSSGTSRADAWYSSINCTFARRCFDMALGESFSFLDGVVFSNGCDHLRRMYDNWRYAGTGPKFLHMFVTPHVVSNLAFERFRDECSKLKDTVKNHFGVSITDDALGSSIKTYNIKRSLMKRLYDMRKQQEVPLSGSEYVSLLLVLSAIPVEDAISLLENLIVELQGRNIASPGAIRIFLAAGHLEEPDHADMIEGGRAVIVADNLCMGLRVLDGLTDESSDAISSLAKRYLEHISCPRMMNDFRRRLVSLEKTVREFSVDAVIMDRIKFCDLWGGEAFIWRSEMKKKGFPVLILERELYAGVSGQIKTRIQAFYEQVKNRRPASDSLTGDFSSYLKR